MDGFGLPWQPGASPLEPDPFGAAPPGVGDWKAKKAFFFPDHTYYLTGDYNHAGLRHIPGYGPPLQSSLRIFSRLEAWGAAMVVSFRHRDLIEDADWADRHAHVGGKKEHKRVYVGARMEAEGVIEKRDRTGLKRLKEKPDKPPKFAPRSGL